ncbi:MAG TPA: hypothetical protein VFN67_25425 [Polyangiales bacterium]|nr:hypothetical protein [Polyangiales bacterium]
MQTLVRGLRTAVGGSFRATGARVLRIADLHLSEVALLEGRWHGDALIRMEATFRSTFVEHLEAHLFTFDETGHVTRFRHFADTHSTR